MSRTGFSFQALFQSVDEATFVPSLIWLSVDCLAGLILTANMQSLFGNCVLRWRADEEEMGVSEAKQ